MSSHERTVCVNSRFLSYKVLEGSHSVAATPADLTREQEGLQKSHSWAAAAANHTREQEELERSLIWAAAAAN